MCSEKNPPAKCSPSIEEVVKNRTSHEIYMDELLSNPELLDSILRDDLVDPRR